MPTILAFDTSSPNCVVSLLHEGKTYHIEKSIPMQQGRFILTFIEELLGKHKLSLDQLDAIAYSAGPGSFTGLRIASATAQGLAFAHQIPIIPLSSLAIIAQAAYLTKGWKNVLVALDARMQQIYWAAYVFDGTMQLMGKEQLVAPDKIETEKSNTQHSWYGIGNGWEIYQEILSKQCQFGIESIESNWLSTGDAMLELALVKYNDKDWTDAKNALPCYLR